ncbi:MAG: hypothetical protein V2I39_05205 [Erythrobacter sp.]|jgi:hypothetical protein|nr:hypothetical protein [Erythrobacter sp.]
MKTLALIAPLILGLAACEQPDEALPPEGELEPALPTEDMDGIIDDGDAEAGDEPEIETIGEPEAPVMEDGSSGDVTPGSKLQRADPDY